MTERPDLRKLIAQEGLRYCKKFLGEDNEQCQLEYDKFVKGEQSFDQFLDKIEHVLSMMEKIEE